MQTFEKTAFEIELEQSAIALDLQALNFHSILGGAGWRCLFYKNTTELRTNTGVLRRKWLKTYSHLDDGGWWCGTLDIIQGDHSPWGCFKANSPRTNSDGKPIKYEHPPTEPTQPFFLEISRHRWEKIAKSRGVALPDLSDIPPSSDAFEFWEWVKARPDIPLILTEGAKKTASLLSANHVAVGISGIWNGSPREKAGDGTPLDAKLNPQLEAIATKGREIVFAFDNDSKPKTVQAVIKATETTAKLLRQKGCKVSVMSWREEFPDLKGIDDVHFSKGAEAIDYLFGDRQSITAWKKQMNKPVLLEKKDVEIADDLPSEIDQQTTEVQTSQPLRKTQPETTRIYGGSKNLNYAQLYAFIEEHLGRRLSFDLMRREMLLDGQIFQVADELTPWFFAEYGETAQEGDLYKTIVHFAKQNSFDPVLRDLERCLATAEKIRIDNLAARYFGQDPANFPDDLDKKKAAMHNRCVEMWLISAVARQFETVGIDGDPHTRGCQADHTLVLQGGQGKGKSTWFGNLCGSYFNESMGDIQAKDSKMVLHGNWILELAEIDQITSKKQAAILKQFLTIRVDEFRVPYGRKSKPHARRSVFCGTVNPSRFLVDDENRRFWTIPVLTEDIELERIKTERDGIWASAVAAYKSGAKWYPTKEEKAILKIMADDFAEIDPWQEPVESYLKLNKFVNTREILMDVCKLELKDIGKRDEMRISKILTRLGWTEEKRIRRGGQSIRVRCQPREEPRDEPRDEQNRIDVAQDPNINPIFNKKVGCYGTSPDTQGFQVYQPPYRPNERLVHTDLVPTKIGVGTEVGTSETQTEQGIEGECTDLPTKNASKEKDSAKYEQAGFKFVVGQSVYYSNEECTVKVAGFPGSGIYFSGKYYDCIFPSGDREWIKQSDLEGIKQ